MQERMYRFDELDTTEEIQKEFNSLRQEICDEFKLVNQKIDSLTKKPKNQKE